MREFVIDLDYPEGVDPVMDVFIEHPKLVLNAVDISAGGGGLTRVDRISGPPDGLEALKAVYLDTSICNECVAPDERCDANRAYEVLADEVQNTSIYTFHDALSFCNAVPYHAVRILPPGLLFDSQRRGNQHRWRILLQKDDAVGDLYEALVREFPDEVTISFKRLTTPKRWGERTGTVADLSPEQRIAIEEAVRKNYYDTPRGTTLADLASELNVPQSTLRYRLRRAEAWLTASSITPTSTGESQGRSADLIRHGSQLPD